jgi:alkylhydroperoxidase family enzyme
VETGSDKPLPAWARALAGPFPRTTAALLELDYLDRERGPLPSALRAQVRWAAANANRCAYAEATALGDLRRAGVSESDLRALVEGRDSLPAREKAVLAFARKLTRAASSVTDAEVAQLLEMYRAEQVVALVLLLAHANFQDRLLLALGLPPEEGGSLPPLPVRFAEGAPGPRRESSSPPVRRPHPAPEISRPVDLERSVLDFSQLQAALEKQRSRRPRIALPSGDPGQINWGLLCRTYQPERAAAWSKCGYACDLETDQNPIFTQSLFWVVTHSEGCFY